MADISLLYATAPDSTVARRIARTLVDEHLAACCNILPGMQSIYWWEGAVQDAEEVVLLVKTTQAMAEAATRRLLALHPYETPAVIQLPVTGGSADFLGWIARNVLPADSII